MATSSPSQPTGENRLLAALPHDEYDDLLAHLEHTSLGVKEVVYERGRLIPHVYFPCSGVASLLLVMRDGASVEIGTVGKEGMIGLPLFLGTDTAPYQVIWQVPGEAMRVAAEAFRHTVKRGGRLSELLSRYTHALFQQTAQSLACNHVHSVEQRCCRWLLMTHDRAGTEEFLLTQEFLSQMMGVRRATVTEVAGKLQKAGLIEYRRGRIRVLDREGLQCACCECYGVIAEEFERLFAPSPAAGAPDRGPGSGDGEQA